MNNPGGVGERCQLWDETPCFKRISVKVKVSGISEKLLDREHFHFLESNIVIVVDVRICFYLRKDILVVFHVKFLNKQTVLCCFSRNVNSIICVWYNKNQTKYILRVTVLPWCSWSLCDRIIQRKLLRWVIQGEWENTNFRLNLRWKWISVEVIIKMKKIWRYFRYVVQKS